MTLRPSSACAPTRTTAPDTAATNSLADEISALATLDLHALRVKWRKLLRKPAPEHLNRSILMRVIAYRMQARVFGDLDAASIRTLETIARDHDRQRKSGARAPRRVTVVAPVPRDRGHRSGTVFIREYAGEMHRVTVVRDGFAWQGGTYPSLSDIARRITGTSWSGPRFFGLRDSTPGA